MLQITSFTFNPFQENTYLLHDETKECVIIDPGCYYRPEQDELSDFIEKNGLKPVMLLNTHCHVDHVFGNAYIHRVHGLKPVFHIKDLPVLESAPAIALSFGVPMETSPVPDRHLAEGEIIRFGDSDLEILFTPGHSPGHVTFYQQAQRFIISGDVLFQQSIGRYDFPGSNYDDLMKSIRVTLLSLGDDVTVYPGHGPSTTIGAERKHNPFLV